MTLKIAIHPDEVVHPGGQKQSFSTRWFELARLRNIEPVPVDAYASDAMSCIAGCNAFMWRYPSSAVPRVYAHKLFYGVERGLGIPVFPSSHSAWFYEDKLAQCYFFESAQIPHAATWISWNRQDAAQFCANADYPFVLKLAGGHQSSNVRLVRSLDEALFYVDEMFSHGVVSLGYRPTSRPRMALRRLRAAAEIMKGRSLYAPNDQSELHYGYFYAQEFLPDNHHEVSAIVIGNRVFACRRFIPPGDFRTRGSAGGIDCDPEPIGEDAIRLAYKVADQLSAQTVAVDILRRGSEPVIVELTVNYASWIVRACPGHWMLTGDPATGKLTWVSGSMRAADAIFEDFLDEIDHAHHAA